MEHPSLPLSLAARLPASTAHTGRVAGRVAGRMTGGMTGSAAASHADIGPNGFGSGPVSLLRRIAAMLSVRRQRDHLAALDADRLSDLGLTRDEVLAEAARPIWDVPPFWRQ